MSTKLGYVWRIEGPYPVTFHDGPVRISGKTYHEIRMHSGEELTHAHFTADTEREALERYIEQLEIEIRVAKADLRKLGTEQEAGNG
jgi:hypothetical protein